MVSGASQRRAATAAMADESSPPLSATPASTSSGTRLATAAVNRSPNASTAARSVSSGASGSARWKTRK
ncbi:hypothetical protein [Nocardia xishanensis]